MESKGKEHYEKSLSWKLSKMSFIGPGQFILTFSLIPFSLLQFAQAAIFHSLFKGMQRIVLLLEHHVTLEAPILKRSPAPVP